MKKAAPIPSTDMTESHILLELSREDDASAVEIFSRQHDSNSPKPKGSYRALIPAHHPSQGEQYAFQVDLDRCSACKSCVSACHHMNGLSDEESWRRVRQWFGEKPGDQWVQTITSACHHCVEPECMHGCPVGAYEKNPLTGIVKHLDDQCIGCEYCIWKCPYEVPRYHEAHGIVRKCDMCSERLANQVEPACVQACPHEAIAIGIADQEDLRHSTKSRGMLVNALYPGAPDSSITEPSTSYHSKRSLRHARWSAIDTPGQTNKPHWPLVWMLLSTQWGVGILTAHFIHSNGTKDTLPSIYGAPFWVGALLISGGLVSSFFHLGQPMKAWRFFLGLRKSWLSREILMFNALAGCLALGGMDAFTQVLSGAYQELLAVSIVLIGWISVFTSVMIYHDTRRPSWTLHLTGAQFLQSILSGAIACSALISNAHPNEQTALPLLTAFAALHLLCFTKIRRHLNSASTATGATIVSMNHYWILLIALGSLFAVGWVDSMPWLVTTSILFSILELFLLDLNGRVHFFLGSTSPVAQPSMKGGHV